MKNKHVLTKRIKQIDRWLESCVILLSQEKYPYQEIVNAYKSWDYGISKKGISNILNCKNRSHKNLSERKATKYHPKTI